MSEIRIGTSGWSYHHYRWPRDNVRPVARRSGSSESPAAVRKAKTLRKFVGIG